MAQPVSLSGYDRALQRASTALGVSLRRRTSEKAVGACPLCGGDDRFIVWVYEGNAWCSRCKHSAAFLDQDETHRLRALSRVQKAERQSKLRATMAKCPDWQQYHRLAVQDPDRMRLWQEEGMEEEDVLKWGLGWCPACPLEPSFPSLTIPVWQDNQLLDIRHKLIGADPSVHGKYRSHLAGFVPQPFNLDAMYAHRGLVLVEGEKKAIVMCRFGYPGTIGLPGINILDDFLDRVAEMQPVQSLVVLLDPGANGQAREIAQSVSSLGVATFIGDSPLKPDDLLLKYGKGPMERVMEQKRRC